MAQGKKSFTAYCDWIDTFEELSDEEAGQLIKHLLRYVNDQDPEPPNRLIKLIFAPLKSTLKRDLKAWLLTCETNRENGKKGGRPKKPNKTEKTHSVNLKAKKADRDRDRDRDRDKDRLIPPFLDFHNYAKEKAKENNITVRDETIKLKYEAWKEAGWKDGNGQVIKSWKSKVCHNLQHWQTSKGNQTEHTASKYDFL